MKKLFFIFLVVMVPGWLAAQPVINDPNVEVRPVSSFHAIKISNAFDLYLSQSDEEALAVSAATPEYRKYIKTSVEDGVLTISYTDEKWLKNGGNRKLKAYVAFKNLDNLSASGACDIIVKGAIKADNLVIELNGASDLKHADIYANTLVVTTSGASDVIISGKVTNLEVEASGASDFKGYDLLTEYCVAEAKGVSDIRITVNKELSVRAGGASNVYYRGNGTLKDLKASGASKVAKRG